MDYGVQSRSEELDIRNNDSPATGIGSLQFVYASNHTFTPFTSDWLLPTADR